MRLARRIVLLVALASPAGAGVGCGKVAGGADGGDAGLSVEQACADLAQAECSKRDSCSKGTSITRVYGEMSVCLTRAALLCSNALAAPDTGASATTIGRCTADYATLSCNDFFDGKLPVDCTPSGSRENGQPCVFAGQCASAYCGGTRNALCGVCAPPPAPGDPCAESLCAHGQVCVEATMTCVNSGILNGSCDANDPCGNGLSCVSAPSTSGGAGTCEVSFGAAGTACGATMPGCNGSLGLFCGGAVGSKTCMAIGYVGDGQPCGALSSSAFALCKAGTCYTDTGVAGGNEMGTCTLDAIEGASCDTATGPSCMSPARCVVSGGGTSGLCMLPTGAACGS